MVQRIDNILSSWNWWLSPPSNSENLTFQLKWHHEAAGWRIWLSIRNQRFLIGSRIRPDDVYASRLIGSLSAFLRPPRAVTSAASVEPQPLSERCFSFSFCLWTKFIRWSRSSIKSRSSPFSFSLSISEAVNTSKGFLIYFGSLQNTDLTPR